MVLKLSRSEIIIVNFMLLIVWHIIILILSRILKDSYFDPKKIMYLEYKWENNGKFYINILKIKKWKDKLPQYVPKNGFSKRHLRCISKLSKEYIEKFIIETCRAEWNHMMCCMYWVVAVFTNSGLCGLFFSIVSIVANLPFLIIQRFNRIRLNNLIKQQEIANNLNIC